MRFEVPQFIDVEDKIFGPFTFKQFLYLAGGAGACYVLWRLLPPFFAILIILPIAALALALTFYRVNGKPFIQVIQAWIGFITQNKLYLWKKGKNKTSAEAPKETMATSASTPKLSGSKLKDIAWSLDVLDMQERDKANTR